MPKPILITLHEHAVAKEHSQRCRCVHVDEARLTRAHENLNDLPQVVGVGFVPLGTHAPLWLGHRAPPRDIPWSRDSHDRGSVWSSIVILSGGVHTMLDNALNSRTTQAL